MHNNGDGTYSRGDGERREISAGKSVRRVLKK
jgi:hypothetical protein